MSEDLNSSLVQAAARKREYKQLLEVGSHAAENIETSSVADTFDALRDLLVKANELASQGNLMDRVGQTAEVVLDAQVCKLSSDLMGTTVQKIKSDEFSDDNFVAALMEHVIDESNICNWSNLDGTATRLAKSFWITPSIFGAINFDEVAGTSQATQKQRRVRRKADPGVEKRLVAVTQPENQEKQITKVEQVYNIIQKVYQKNGKKPIPYYQLVIDPSNMMLTFDNTFQVSFLFRDGLIAFVKDDEGLPAIKPMSETARQKKPSENTSFVSSLDFKTIQKYIEKYNIREPMIKIPREK